MGRREYCRSESRSTRGLKRCAPFTITKGITFIGEHLRIAHFYPTDIVLADFDRDGDKDVAPRGSVRRDRHFEPAVPLVRKEVVGFFNLIQREPMGDERP